MPEDHPEQTSQPILVASVCDLNENGEDHVEDSASASGPDVLVIRAPVGEADSCPDDMPASPRGFLAAARERGCGFLGVETDGGGAVLPILPTFGGG